MKPSPKRTARRSAAGVKPPSQIGGCGFWTLTFWKSKNSLLNVTGSLRQPLDLLLEAGRGVEKHSDGMPPNLLAHYFYLWEPTVVRQAIEPAWTSASVRRTFVELLVPAG